MNKSELKRYNALLDKGLNNNRVLSPSENRELNELGKLSVKARTKAWELDTSQPVTNG